MVRTGTVAMARGSDALISTNGNGKVYEAVTVA
jgi:hypothetical protein